MKRAVFMLKAVMHIWLIFQFIVNCKKKYIIFSMHLFFVFFSSSIESLLSQAVFVIINYNKKIVKQLNILCFNLVRETLLEFIQGADIGDGTPPLRF